MMPTQRPVRFLSREIGDDTLLVENRVLPYRGMYDAEKYVGVNQRSFYYQYPNYSTSLTIPGVYSRDKPLDITGSSGYGLFYAQQANVQYDPPYTGGYSINPLNWTACCDDYLRPAPTGIKQTKKKPSGVLVYPNPVRDGRVDIQFQNGKFHAGRVKVFDILGREIYDQRFKADNGQFQVSLGTTLPSGFYLFLISDGTHSYQKRVVIQNNQF